MAKISKIKIVINNQFGGAKLSDEALQMIKDSGDPGLRRVDYPMALFEGPVEVRMNPTLISIVEKLGEKASVDGALVVIEEDPLPEGFYFDITDYDGREDVVIKRARR